MTAPRAVLLRAGPGKHRGSTPRQNELTTFRFRSYHPSHGNKALPATVDGPQVAGGYRVDDVADQALAYVYGCDAHGPSSEGPHVMRRAGSQSGIARLPELMAPRSSAPAADE
jgi:hypothetical protein